MDWKNFKVSVDAYHKGDEQFTATEYEEQLKTVCIECSKDGKYRLANRDGYYFVEKVPEPTIEEQQALIQKQLTNVVQHVLDAKAQELLYDSCLSVCSYIDTGVPKFDAEGKAFRAWRSQVWAKGYDILAQVQTGERAIPTEAELIAELPELTIVYEETDTPKSSLDYLNSLGQ